MIKLKIGGLSLQVPSAYEELRPHQATYALGVRSTVLPIVAQQLIFLHLLLVGSAKYFWQRWYVKLCLRNLSDDRLYNLFPLTNFFFEEITTTKPLLTEFRLQGVHYFSPDDKLKNCTFVEFIRAEDALRNYYQTKDITHLHLLVAILYRPTHDNARREDKREPFNDYLTSQRVTIMQGLHEWQLTAIVCYFQNCLKALQQQYRKLYEKDEPEDEEENSSPQTPQNPLLQWFSVIRQLAENPTNFEAIANLNVHAVLFELVERQKEYEEYQRKQPTDFQKPLHYEDC
jgi:hypothetical protein